MNRILEPGEPFALQKVFKTQSNLRDLDIFESVQVQTIGLKEKESKVDLLVRVAEKDPYYFEAAAGYQTDKGFFGRSEVGDLNFLGTRQKYQDQRRGKSGRISVGRRHYRSPLPGKCAQGRSEDLSVERSEPFNLVFGTDTLGGTLR